MLPSQARNELSVCTGGLDHGENLHPSWVNHGNGLHVKHKGKKTKVVGGILSRCASRSGGEESTNNYMDGDKSIGFQYPT